MRPRGRQGTIQQDPGAQVGVSSLSQERWEDIEGYHLYLDRIMYSAVRRGGWRRAREEIKRLW